MRVSFAGFRSSLPFSGLIRQFEQEMETVMNVLQPGPLGIVEHKFSAKEISEAKATKLWFRQCKGNDQFCFGFVH
ncbi:hypothetical protein K1719_037707 [Acacia pycnantha]|nr:hypothetical protein K1719_037707 [Acacia pycnantha]